MDRPGLGHLADLATAQKLVAHSTHSAFPIADDDAHVVGIVSRGDLLDDVDPAAPVTEVAAGDVVTISANTPLQAALSTMVEAGVDHLPVVEEGRLVGICTRTDVLTVRARQLEHERLEHGWLGRRRQAPLVNTASPNTGPPSAAEAHAPNDGPGQHDVAHSDMHVPH